MYEHLDPPLIPQKKEPIMKKLLFALLLACTLMLCLASCDKKKATTTRPIEYVKTSLREMEQEWYQNKARANDKYNGAYVMIYAIVREINGESFVVEESLAYRPLYPCQARAESRLNHTGERCRGLLEGQNTIHRE